MTHLLTEIVVCFYVLVLFHRVDSNCDFPTDLQNATFKSSNFVTLQFQVNTFDYAEDGITSWICHLNDGQIYVVRSEQTATEIGTSVYFYYCFSFTRETQYSYSYYLLSQIWNGKRRKSFPTTFAATLAIVCDDTLQAAEFNVIVNTAAPTSAKSYCATPLLGDFLYTFYDNATDAEKCGSLPGDGRLNVCTNDARDELVYNYTSCSEQVGYSTGGILYCIAYKSSTSGTDTTYYQSLYNADATPVTQFTCMAVTSTTDAGGTSRVYVSQIQNSCTASQSSTVPPDSSGDTMIMTANAIQDPVTEDEGLNLGLIIGICLAGLVLLALIGGILFYCCYLKNREKDDKPIVENTKPRFEDPDADDMIEDIIDLEDNASTIITRDDIAFEAGSPSLIPNGKPLTHANGIPTTNKGSYVMFNGGMANGSLANDSGIAMTEISSERPIPRIGLNQSKEAMVIFNGDEKVISGNDSRVIPAENPNARTFRTMDDKPEQDMTLFLDALEENEAVDSVAELSNRDYQYPSLPREKSNLMPPIETIDPEKDKNE